MEQSYIITNKEELKRLFDQSHADIKVMIKGGEVKSSATNLGQIYKIPISKYVALSNIVTSVLIGALDPKNVIFVIKENVGLDEINAIKLAEDLEKGIFEKARQINMGATNTPVVNLEFKGERTKDELREEIMDTTKRDSALVKPQSSPTPKKSSVITPGSRSQLLEQLQVLGAIPKDAEIEERLKHIQEQISSIKKVEETNTLQSNIALKSFMFGEKGKEVADAVLKTATYSVAPTHYNLDPYREIPEE